MLRLLVHLHALAVCHAHAHAHGDDDLRPDVSCAPRRLTHDVGQTTAEYALVLLGAAAVAGMLITWASKSGAIGKLFDAVMSSVIGSVT